MRRSLLLALPLILPFMANDAQAAAAVTTAYQFAETTPLATGNWVRISTGESGVYEITYAELRTMGFSDPSKVAVYGLSGAVGEMNFLDIKGNRIIDDVIRPVRIMHTNDKILFYAEGPERLDFTMTGSGMARRGIHSRVSKSIYSDSACYFLTDSHQAEFVPESEVEDKTKAITAPLGYAVVYHEEDLKQGFFNCGRIFWGEEIKVGKPVAFNINVPYAVSDSPCATNCDVAVWSNQTGNLTIKLNAAERSYTLSRTEAQIFNWDNVLYTSKLTVNSNHEGKATLSFKATGNYDENTPLPLITGL